MRIDFVSLFPEFFDSFFDHSMIRRALEAQYLAMSVINPRDFAHNKHNQVDDTPYGGGAGMLMMAPPIFEAVESIPRLESSRVIFMGPTGRRFNQDIAKELASYDQLILLCGHYEGVDYRVEEHLVDETISIGDFVLTGGELPAMIIADAVARMIPGVLGASAGAAEDSFYQPRLECPQYTKPRVFRDWEVPEVLLSGHHKNIEEWRLTQSMVRTAKLRPELLDRELSSEERGALKALGLLDRSGHFAPSVDRPAGLSPAQSGINGDSVVLSTEGRRTVDEHAALSREERLVTVDEKEGSHE